MTFRASPASGLEYLDKVTTLLQTARLASPTGGVWEAADLQWWWRRDQHADPRRQRIWFDGPTPVAAAVLTDWGDRWGCDVLSNTHHLGPVVDEVWPATLTMIEAVEARPVDLTARDDDAVLVGAAAAAGFVPTDEVGVTTSMPAAERPPIAPLPPGYTLVSRQYDPGRPHPLIRRNGDHVAARLAECSLYDPDLDLAVYDPADDVAAYGVFWADPVTGVGLVEPMRTEDAHQRRGLARGVLTAGLDRLARRGCRVLKVTYMTSNDGARRLYLGTGFHAGAPSRTFRLAAR